MKEARRTTTAGSRRVLSASTAGTGAATRGVSPASVTATRGTVFGVLVHLGFHNDQDGGLHKAQCGDLFAGKQTPGEVIEVKPGAGACRPAELQYWNTISGGLRWLGPEVVVIVLLILSKMRTMVVGESTSRSPPPGCRIMVWSGAATGTSAVSDGQWLFPVSAPGAYSSAKPKQPATAANARF